METLLHDRLRAWLPVLALLSGIAGLVYETIWLRWFRLLFGSTAYAASATLCAFFAGLALGAYWFGRRVERSGRPLALYAAIEVGAAATALVVPLAISAYAPIYGWFYEHLAENRTLFVAVKFALSFVAIVPCATLLGGTLPALAAAYVGDPAAMGRRAGTLYATNTLGAALGTAIGALWLPEAVGVSATYAVAIGLSLSVAAVALWLGRSATPKPSPGGAGRGAGAPRNLISIAFVSGFGVLAFEVLLIQAIALSLQNSVYSFGAVLIVVLLTLAIGAALVAASSGRISARALLLGALLTESLLLLILPFESVTLMTRFEHQLESTFQAGMGVAVVLGAPALLVAGLVFPLTFRLVEGGAVGPRIGGLLAANTVGGIFGSLCASFLLLDWLGLWTSMAVLAVLYAAAAVALPGSLGARASRAAVFGGFAGILALAGANPMTLSIVDLGVRERLVAVAEGAHGVVSVVEVATDRLKIDRHLKVDNEYVLSGSLAQIHQRRMGHLPILLHEDPKRVMFVGSATGETASSALLHPVDEIVLVELVPEVQELAAEHFADANRGVYTDPRTRVVVEDGRNHIRGAQELYDVIVTDLFVPQRPGVGAMYSVEHFEAVRRRLAPGGVFCVWLPIYQHDLELFRTTVATFLAVFPDATLWRGDFFVGTPTAGLIAVQGEATSVGRIDAAVRRLGERSQEDRWVGDPEGFWMFYLGRAADAIAGIAPPLNTDDRPRFEYLAPRATPETRVMFRLRDWPMITQRVLAAVVEPDAAYPGRPLQPAKGGIAFRRAARLVLADGKKRLPEARALITENVAPSMLSGPDVTVSEIWPFAAKPTEN
jgi:spermidine synthase